jgi:PAS domain S-box-containing protein
MTEINERSLMSHLFPFLHKSAVATPLLLLLVVFTPRLSGIEPAANILIIHSYNSEYAWTRYQENGFLHEVKNSQPAAEFFVEYLDAKRMVLAAYRNELAHLIKEKYGQKHITVMYTTDDVATEFVHEFSTEMGLGEIPLVASGINNLKNIDTTRYPLTIGIHEVLNTKAEMELALEQNPDTQRIVILSDYTNVGNDIADDIRNQSALVTRLPVERMPPLAFRDTIDYVRRFDRQTLFIFGTFSSDKDGRYVSAYDSATAMAKAAPGPVYATHNTHTESPEIVGGYVNSGEDQGRIAGNVVVQLLNATPVKEVVISEPRFIWIFNYPAMSRFGISAHNLPPGSILVGKPDSIIEKHPILTAVVLLGITAQTLLIVFLLINITRRNAATKALRQSEAKLRLLLENSPLAIFICDDKGNIEILNNRFRTLFGYTLEDANTIEAMRRLLVPDPDYRDKITRLMQANYAFSKQNNINMLPVEYVASAKNGIKLDIETYYEEAGGMVIRILHNVTERNSIMRELKQATTAARAANEAKSRFIANVSREIRAPMNGILGTAQILTETGMTRHQTECVEKITNSCNLILTVINDILDLARIETGKLTLNPQPMNLPQLLGSIAASERGAIEEKGLSFSNDFRDSLPQSILSDPDRIKQVIHNLLDNARKFTEKGGIGFHVACYENNDRRCRIHFVITDTGIGIPSEMQQAIFEPFVQVDNQGRHENSGSGLGLPISRKLVQLMGGDVMVESEPGHGSTFSFDIVCDVVTSEVVDTAGRRLWEETAKLYPLKILVAEDNPGNQRDIGLILGKMGYDYQMVSNGIEAVEIAEHNHFDVVLMDLLMPMLGGLEATTRIRRAAPEGGQPRIYGLTTHSQEEDIQRCRDAGMNGCLLKPIRSRSLQTTLMEAFKEIHPSRAE